MQIVQSREGLSVESWTPGATVLDTKKTDIDALRPWNELNKRLEHVSGVGTFAPAFEMPEGLAEGQADWLHMCHAKDVYGVKINGAEVLAE